MTRQDIGTVHAGVQAAHAVLDAARHGLVPLGEPHPNFVVCGLPDLSALLCAAAHLEARGVKFHVWSDDLFDNQPTALCTEPLRGARRKHLARYHLLKDGRACTDSPGKPRPAG